MNHRTTARRRALRLVAPLAAAAAALALVSAGSPAQAVSSKTPSKAASAAETDAVRSFSKAQIEAIVKNAKPLAAPANKAADGLVPVGGANGVAQKFAGVAPKGSATKASGPSADALIGYAGYDGALWPGANTANPNLQIGKLYFDTDPGPAYSWSWCTGAVVNSENRSMVLTAGHCVWNTSARRWYSNWLFYPGYQYGASSSGVWSYRLASTTNNYYNYGYSKEDMAIVLLNRNSAGQTIVDRVGAHGISFNQAVGQYRYSFGYPITDSRWPGYTANGEDMRYCYGYDYYYSSGSFAGQMNLTCRMTGGASGGPWLTNIQSNWLGYANSVNSNKGGIGSAWAYYMFGPYFGNEELAVYNAWRAA